MVRTRRTPTFPIPVDQLPRIHVSPEQHDELRAFLHPMVHDIVRHGPTWGRSNVASAQRDGWKIAASSATSCFLTKSSSSHPHRSAPSLAKRSTKALPSTTSAATQPQPPQPPPPPSPSPPLRTPGQCFMGSTPLPELALEDIMSSVYCETTAELRAHYTDMYGAACLDCCVLATLERATLADPFWYVGIKWVVMRSPVRKLIAHREFVFLEHSGSHVDPRTNKRVLYRIFQSINLRAYGGRDAYFGLTRGHIEAAIVYSFADDATDLPGCSLAQQPMLWMATKGRAHLRGRLPLWLVQLYLRQFWASTLLPASTTTASNSAEADVEERDDDDDNDDSDKSPLSLLLVVPGAGSRWSALPSASASASSSHWTNRKLSSSSSSSSSHNYNGGLAHRTTATSSPTTSTSHAPLEMATTWIPDDARSTCFVCDRRFQRVRRPKHHCRSCGEVICSECTRYSTLTHRSSPSAGTRQRKVRLTATTAADDVLVGKVCLRCLELRNIMHNNSTAFVPVAPSSDAPALAVERDLDSSCSSAKQQQQEQSRGNSQTDSVQNDTHVAVVHYSTMNDSVDNVAAATPSDTIALLEAVGHPRMYPPAASLAPSVLLEARYSDAAQSDCGTRCAAFAVDDDSDRDDSDDDDDDDNTSECLEFQPVRAPGDDNCGHALSLASFDPDLLLDLQAATQHQQVGHECFDCLDSDSDASDCGSVAIATTTTTSPTSVLEVEIQKQHQRELLRAPLSPSTMSGGTTRVSTPTAFATAATTATARRLSITDVRIAIADNVMLLDVLKRNHEVQLVP